MQLYKVDTIKFPNEAGKIIDTVGVNLSSHFLSNRAGMVTKKG